LGKIKILYPQKHSISCGYQDFDEFYVLVSKGFQVLVSKGFYVLVSKECKICSDFIIKVLMHARNTDVGAANIDRHNTEKLSTTNFQDKKIQRSGIYPFFYKNQ